MGILNRISKVLESNLNALVDRAEDPAKLLDQAIEDMKKGRDDIQKAMIDAKTEKRLIEKRTVDAKNEAAALEKKAMLALRANDEGLARKLVEAKIAAEKKSEAEQTALSEHEKQIVELEAAKKDLDRKIAEMPARRAALLARKAAAEAKGARTGASLKGSSAVGDALAAFERIEERVVRSEVEADVRAESTPKAIDTSHLEALEADEALASLKAKMAKELPAKVSKSEPAKEVEDSLAALKARLTNPDE